MPSNPTWNVMGQKGRSSSKRKVSHGSNWLRQGVICVAAACVGAMVVASVRAFMNKKERLTFAQVSEGSTSVLNDKSVPEFGQAAVNAQIDQPASALRQKLRPNSPDQVGLLGPKPVPRRKRKIILSDGQGKWNTGVWPAWGYDRPTLNWAAAGVVVDKYCPTECEFTRDQNEEGADAVVMELVNHPKFGISEDVPVPWPSKRPNPKAAEGIAHPTAMPATVPLTAVFYYEPAQAYPKYTLLSDSVREHADITMSADQDSTLSISMVRSRRYRVWPSSNRLPDLRLQKPPRLVWRGYG